MLGLGKWVCSVDSMFFKGEVYVTIADNNGEYDINLEIPEERIPEFEIYNVTVEGQTLFAKAKVEMLKGKDIDIEITFEEDAFVGFLKIPFIGKVKLKDGRKVV